MLQYYKICTVVILLEKIIYSTLKITEAQLIVLCDIISERAISPDCNSADSVTYRRLYLCGELGWREQSDKVEHCVEVNIPGDGDWPDEHRNEPE